MRPPEEREERLHRRICELLPWYVNGTLDERERQAVEEHAAHCPQCRDEIESCRRLQAVLSHAGELAPSPHPARLSRLLERLAESESRSRWARLRSLSAATPAPVRRVLAAQLAALLLLAGALGWTSVSGGAAPVSLYRTLSDPPPAAAPGSSTIRVVFAEEATEQQIRRLLLDVGGELAGGPSPLGAYTVKIPAGRDPLPLVLNHLRSQPEIRFAEPVAAGER